MAADELELSPIARARLERVGKLTDEQQRALQRGQDVEAMLSAYYTGTTNGEGLWQTAKQLTEKRGPDIIPEAQSSILHTLKLHTNDEDFERRKTALLALESLKGSDRYSAIEMLFGSVDSLRQRFNEVTAQAFEQVRAQMEPQLRAQAEQARMQGMLVDTTSTIEASIKGSPEWRNFMAQHEESHEKTLHDYIERISGLL